jgi:hypothetical protein
MGASVGETETARQHVPVAELIHEVGVGLLITHRPGGRLAAWPLRIAPDGGAAWTDGKLPVRARFLVEPVADLIRQVTDCPRVSSIFQNGHRYCFLCGLARISLSPPTVVLEMEVLAAECDVLAGAGDLWERSLDAALGG